MRSRGHMAKLSKATEHALNVIAHVVMASDMSKKVKGMEGYRDHYMKQMPAADRAIFRRFETVLKKAYADTARLLQDDLEGAPGSAEPAIADDHHTGNHEE